MGTQVFGLLQLGIQPQASTAVLQCLVKLPCAQGLSARRVGALLSSAATTAHQLLPGLCSLPAANVYNLMSACAAALHMLACILGLAGLKGAQSLSAIMLQKVLQACLVSHPASASVAVGALLGLPAARGLGQGPSCCIDGMCSCFMQGLAATAHAAVMQVRCFSDGFGKGRHGC